MSAVRGVNMHLAPTGEQVIREVLTQVNVDLLNFFPSPKGDKVVDAICVVLALDLKQRFRTALTYPKCVIKVQGSFTFFEGEEDFLHIRGKVKWQSDFYSSPQHYEGEIQFKHNCDLPHSELVELGLESKMEMFSFELQMQQGGGALREPGIPPTPQLEEGEMVSAGRRDPTRRRGAGVEFSGGAPLSSSLREVGDVQKLAGEARGIMADVPPNENQEGIRRGSLDELEVPPPTDFSPPEDEQ